MQSVLCWQGLGGRVLWGSMACGGRHARATRLVVLARGYTETTAAQQQQAPRSQQRGRPAGGQRPRSGGRGSGGRSWTPGGHRGGSAAAAPPPPPLQQRRQVPLRPDYFYAEATSSFEQLGLSPAVAAALRAAGFTKPSRVQELVVPKLLESRDVVLAAETGSGKTLAYLAPIATALLQHKEAAAAATEDSSDSLTATNSELAAGLQRAAAEARQPLALVLVPNTALAAQVIAAADLLRGADGAPLLRAVTVSSRSPPPFERPDLVVTTPGALVTLLREFAGYGRLWTPEGLADAVRHVVVDEADLLLTGGYERDLTAILDWMKGSERRAIEDAAAAQLRVSPEALRGLPRPLKMELWSGGVRGLIAAGWRRPGAARGRGGVSSEDLPEGMTDAAAAFRKQYAFVAATMPAVSREDVGSELQRRYRGATWIAGDLLHQSKPSLQHEWVEVSSEDAWSDALVTAVTGGSDYANGTARVLVFARDVSSADGVAGLLARQGVGHHVYHKSVTQEQREAALAALAKAAAAADGGSSGSNSSGNVVVVCTDAAARGIDLPGITHVIQADFATNAVDFLHRIGRTARADRGGRVTSLVSPEAAVLAGALRDYIAEGRPVEGCFSRNRSFSKKVKRYGAFVPRGETGDSDRGGGSERAG